MNVEGASKSKESREKCRSNSFKVDIPIATSIIKLKAIKNQAKRDINFYYYLLM